MLPEERRTQILDIINSKGNVRICELSETFNVIDETIRRDLRILDEKGLAKRTHGGAIAIRERREIPFDVRRQTNVEAKQLIAKKAAELINPGDILFLDISSTTMFLARELCNKNDITIISNSAILVPELFVTNESVTFISTGGILRPNSYSLVGPLANQTVKKYHADKFFCSSRGFSLQYGVSDANELESEVKKNMLRQSLQLYLMVDHTKFDLIGLTQFAEAKQVDTIITDDQIDRKKAKLIEEAGITLL